MKAQNNKTKTKNKKTVLMTIKKCNKNVSPKSQPVKCTCMCRARPLCDLSDTNDVLVECHSHTLLSLTLFKTFLEKITTDALENHEGTVSIGGRTITNLRFADDIDGLAGEEEELANLVERFDKASTAYGMEISAEKTKLRTNSSGINKEIKVNGQKLETVTSFKYLGSVITDEGSKPEILSRIAQTTAALTRLKPVWIDKSISVSSKIRLMRSLVTSIFLYACESWTLTAELQRRIQTMDMRCYRRILHISYKDHVTNEEVRAKIQQAIGPHEDLTIVNRRKLQWYGHDFRSSGLTKTILQGKVKGG